jgi:hypothetical protein
MIGVALVAGAAACASSLAAQTPKERCTQLIDFFDYYGTSRKENSDGSRNHTRIGAEIDCGRGLYEQGIKEMEDLLRRKKFTVPPPPA